MIRCSGRLCRITTPTDHHEHGDTIDQVERREWVDHVAEARVLHQNSAATDRQVGRTGNPSATSSRTAGIGHRGSAKPDINDTSNSEQGTLQRRLGRGS